MTALGSMSLSMITQRVQKIFKSFARKAQNQFEVKIKKGFYGNAFAYSVVAITAGELCARGLGYALELTYIVSDVSHAGFKSVDFGWGEAVYGGPAKDGEGPIPGVTNYFSRSKNGKGEEGTVVPISLPKNAMDKFQLDVECLTAEI
uniref:Uncharacterized protein n=1 Tax=Aegilops tauschii TaxID=37682 RepID=M8C3V7_AEGTA